MDIPLTSSYKRWCDLQNDSDIKRRERTLQETEIDKQFGRELFVLKELL